MSRLLWPLAVVIALFIGWVTAGVASKTPAVREIERLTQQVTTLQAKLRVAEEMASAGPTAVSVTAGGRSSGRYSGSEGQRSQAAFAQEDRLVQESLARSATTERARNPQMQGDAASAPSDSKAKAAPPATVQAVLDRFYRYLEATKTSERDRWQKGRELVEDMRGMGDVAGQALMHVLTAGTDTDERRVAARMLGAPDSLPVLERLLANSAEDRFIRLSAAQGLASSGRPYGVAGLAQIFEEAAADGRGRDAAFRSLSGLNDDRPLPFMRQVVASQAEPGYRLLAIRYLTARNDKSALPTLQTVMQSPTEQPSVRDAAAQAYRTLGGK